LARGAAKLRLKHLIALIGKILGRAVKAVTVFGVRTAVRQNQERSAGASAGFRGQIAEQIRAVPGLIAEHFHAAIAPRGRGGVTVQKMVDAADGLVIDVIGAGLFRALHIDHPCRIIGAGIDDQNIGLFFKKFGQATNMFLVRRIEHDMLIGATRKHPAQNAAVLSWLARGPRIFRCGPILYNSSLSAPSFR